MMDYEPVKKITSNPKFNEQKMGLLNVRTANACIMEAKNMAIPQKLCGEFWHENEVCILFADTGVGKSVLAVQIADCISRGIKLGVFGSEAIAQKVLYLDFELSLKQFEKRYSINWENHYLWDSKLLRVVINPTFTDFDDFEKQLFIEIEANILIEGVKVVIVDNITYLRMQSTESGKEAIPLMKHLIMLKNKFGLSLLVLAHTPKRPNPTMPLTINDLAGSKQLSNFADSIFCIGRSTQGKDLRYIKQLKARFCSEAEGVMVCELNQPYNFLQFEFIEYDNEQNHLMNKSEADEEMKAKIVEMKAENADISLRDMAEKMGTNHTKISRVIKKYNL